MSITPPRQALYYPFHLCSALTLERLLERYDVLHFRDYMALQLTTMSGTTAYADRMGNFHAHLVREGRIVQGYPVSGPLDADMVASVDRDLTDRSWRALFHDALGMDRRFQRGLFELTHAMRLGGTVHPGPAVLLAMLDEARATRPLDVQAVRRLSAGPQSLPQAYDYEYGLALIKTSAALVYTVRLCHTHRLEAVTDSQPHFRLLSRSCQRDGITIQNEYIPEMAGP